MYDQGNQNDQARSTDTRVTDTYRQLTGSMPICARSDIIVSKITILETASDPGSMTGHLVLSTLHTNDAPSAVATCSTSGCSLSAGVDTR